MLSAALRPSPRLPPVMSITRSVRSNRSSAYPGTPSIVARVQLLLIRHALRNSLMPLITIFGLDFATLIGGAALVTETVFNIPGIGQYEAQAIGNLDVPPILVGAMFTAFAVVLISAITDIVYALLDPRIRLEG